jgi:hypothetical protein
MHKGFFTLWQALFWHFDGQSEVKIFKDLPLPRTCPEPIFKILELGSSFSLKRRGKGSFFFNYKFQILRPGFIFSSVKTQPGMTMISTLVCKFLKIPNSKTRQVL